MKLPFKDDTSTNSSLHLPACDRVGATALTPASDACQTALTELPISIIVTDMNSSAVNKRVVANQCNAPWERTFLDGDFGLIAVASSDDADAVLSSLAAQDIEAALIPTDHLRWLVLAGDDIENGHAEPNRGKGSYVAEQLQVLQRSLRKMMTEEMKTRLTEAETSRVACRALQMWSSWSSGTNPTEAVNEKPDYSSFPWALTDLDLYPSANVEILHRDGHFICFSDCFYTSSFESEWILELGAESINQLNETQRTILDSKLYMLKEAQKSLS